MKIFNPDKFTDEDMFHISIKIDGVRGHKSALEGWTSRANKPLYNLPMDVPDGIYEIYLGDFKSSISACRTHEGSLIHKDFLFSLVPIVDHRISLYPGSKEDIVIEFKRAIDEGYEGLVVTHIETNEQYKLKQIITHDCKIIDIQEGTNKNIGKLGALVVELDGSEFKVGTGLTDKNRIEFFTKDVIGKIIEVKAMEVLPSGKLRHPRFIRMREDLK